jgi:hypothetical protein
MEKKNPPIHYLHHKQLEFEYFCIKRFFKNHLLSSMTLAYSWHSFFPPHMLMCQANYTPKIFDTNIHSKPSLD